MTPLFKRWLNALHADAWHDAEHGWPVPGFKMIDGRRGRRKWKENCLSIAEDKLVLRVGQVPAFVERIGFPGASGRVVGKTAFMRRSVISLSTVSRRGSWFRSSTRQKGYRRSNRSLTFCEKEIEMADDKKVVEGRIQIKNARISFCDSLFVAKGFRGRGDDGKEDENKAKRFKANFLFPKTSAGQSEQGVTAKYKGVVGPVFALLKKAKHDAIVVKLGEEKATAMASKIKPDKYAIRDGDLETWDGYEDNFYVSAANQRPPKVVGRDPKQS